MNTLYWISTLGSLKFVMVLLSFLTGCACCVLFVYFVSDEYSSGNKTPTKAALAHDSVKLSFLICAVSTLFSIFIPSQQDIYMIYGLGTTIDYCKENAEIKELPENAIKALNEYLKSVNNDKSNENKNTNKE